MFIISYEIELENQICLFIKRGNNVCFDAEYEKLKEEINTYPYDFHLYYICFNKDLNRFVLKENIDADEEYYGLIISKNSFTLNEENELEINSSLHKSITNANFDPYVLNNLSLKTINSYFKGLDFIDQHDLVKMDQIDLIEKIYQRGFYIKLNEETFRHFIVSSVESTKGKEYPSFLKPRKLGTISQIFFIDSSNDGEIYLETIGKNNSGIIYSDDEPNPNNRYYLSGMLKEDDFDRKIRICLARNNNLNIKQISLDFFIKDLQILKSYMCIEYNDLNKKIVELKNFKFYKNLYSLKFI